jgi:2-iminobutanoate/2-iminopropanoate deaminase
MLKLHNPTSVHAPVSPYSHGIEVPPNARWLAVSGQVGVRPDGQTPPDSAAQIAQAWENLVSVLQSAGMGVRDVVKVTAFLVNRDDIQAWRQARDRYLQGHRAASTLLLVAGLASPDWKVEIECVAAKG